MKFYRNDPEKIAHKMGMGDAFTSGFAVALCHGNSIDDCVKFGNDVSLKVANNRGSQRGLPYLKDFGWKCFLPFSLSHRVFKFNITIWYC